MHEKGGEDAAVWIAIQAADPLRAIGLQAILEEGLGFRTTILESELRARDRKPTILIVDEGPEADPKTASTLERAISRTPDVPIVLLAHDGSAEAATVFLASGARGVLPATAEVAQIRACVRAVLRGKVWQSSAIKEAPAVTEASQPLQGATLAERFTPKEREVLQWLSQGHSNRQIAATMSIDEATVKAHLGRMLRKADASNRVELTLRALAGEKSRPVGK